jgi:hypothetical protein
MNCNQHQVGFENEQLLSEMFKSQSHIPLWNDFKLSVGTLDAFRRKPCIRLLRYLGYETSSDDFFKHCEIYESIDFNGATYSIKGYSDTVGGRVIGCNHFEWIKKDIGKNT